MRHSCLRAIHRLQRSSASLKSWASTFFSKKVWTKGGLVEFFALFFINVATRRVHIAGMTPNPNSAWMAQQARNMNSFFDELPERATLLIRDHDSKYTAEFDAIFKSEGIETKKVGPMAPNLNAYAERWVQSVRQECLEHFIVSGVALRGSACFIDGTNGCGSVACQTSIRTLVAPDNDLVQDGLD